MIYYKYYQDVPLKEWRWPNFTPKELASKGNGSILVHEESLDKLQELRNLVGHPLKINCGYRDPIHNAKVGGAPMSLHKFGRAFDISIVGIDKVNLALLAQHVGFTGMGFYNTFLHVDTGTKRYWGKKWI